MRRINLLRLRLESLPIKMWTLERFGLTPGKLRYRVSNPGMASVLCVSIPKAGTHLLERAICLHPRWHRKILPTVSPGMQKWDGLDALLARLRPGQVAIAHLPYHESYREILSRHDVKTIFVMRDPRDIVVSQVHYTERLAHHPHHDAFSRRPAGREQLELAILGDPDAGIPSIRERLDRYAGWLNTADLAVRFEDLVGPAGAGDRGRQEHAIRSIYNLLHMEVDDAFVQRICDSLFSGDSPTFRKGTIAQWRRDFDPEMAATFERAVDGAMDPYGYAL
jgi:hypothetical protein